MMGRRFTSAPSSIVERVAFAILLLHHRFTTEISCNHYVASALVPPFPVAHNDKSNKFTLHRSESHSQAWATSSSSTVQLRALFSAQAEVPTEGYDVIVVGSGNGACGFLTRYLESAAPNIKILVLEQGKNFFYTSDITHQNSWTQSFAEGNIFKLHNARTPDGKPILAGRACTMGGGGSINYTMIHESSRWLAQHLGRNEAYWDDLKRKLNARFKRPDPITIETPITKHILDAADSQNYRPAKSEQLIANIPSYDDTPSTDGSIGQLYQFPTQFNEFGQRTNSGVSLVNWDDPRVHLKTNVVVTDLIFDTPSTNKGQAAVFSCVALDVKDSDAPTKSRITLKAGGRVVLCAGAASPRLLMPYRDQLNNLAIGDDVNDHFAIPLGLYVPQKTLDVSPKDIYAPVFVTTVYRSKDQDGIDTVCCFDFFTGRLEQLLYLTSHLFLAFLPNAIKSPLLEQPILFAVTKNVIRTLVSALNLVIALVADGADRDYITAIVKYSPATSGVYNNDGSNRITLRWFESEQDKIVAKKVISDNLALLEKLGSKPHPLVQWIYHTLTKIPFDQNQVDRYIEHYSQNTLLSEQHMAGGCLFGKAVDLGMDNPSRTGQVFGTTNLHVADLSTITLPRISPQMTAYLVGFHVANQLVGSKVT